VQLVEHAQELQACASLWVINSQDADSTARFKDRRNVPFVFLADENLEEINLYGIYHMRHRRRVHWS
jgi:peroxiredoxin